MTDMTMTVDSRCSGLCMSLCGSILISVAFPFVTMSAPPTSSVAEEISNKGEKRKMKQPGKKRRAARQNVEPNPVALKFICDMGLPLVDDLKGVLANQDVPRGVARYCSLLNLRLTNVTNVSNVDIDASIVYLKDEVDRNNPPGDGNCLFAALGLKNHMRRRRKIACWLQSHAEDEVVVSGIATGKVKDSADGALAAHCKHLAESVQKPWPGELEIFALSRMRNWYIEVCQQKHDGNYYKLASYGRWCMHGKQKKVLEWAGNHFIRLYIKDQKTDLEDAMKKREEEEKEKALEEGMGC